MFSLKKMFIVIMPIFFLNLTAYADPGNSGQGNGRGVGHGMSHEHGPHTKAVHASMSHARGSNNLASISKTDRKTIANFFNANPFPASSLPPGIAMNLARGKPLPPGIAKKYLPSDLLSKLSPHPGYEYLLVGDDVLLVNSTTQIIDDILYKTLK